MGFLMFVAESILTDTTKATLWLLWFPSYRTISFKITFYDCIGIKINILILYIKTSLT